MDQSRSSNAAPAANAAKPIHAEVTLPRRSFSIEFFVGVFTMLGVAAAGFLSVGLAGLSLSDSDKYEVYAEFDNVSGLKYGAAVEMAGVPIGEVAAITLSDPMAVLTLKINRSVRLREDDILAIRTKGIIGDRYVKVSRGAGDEVKDGAKLTETESVVDIEDVIGKVIHSLSGDKDKDGDKKDEAKEEPAKKETASAKESAAK